MILSVIFIESCQSRDTDGKTLKSVCLSKKRTKIVEKGKEGEGGGVKVAGPEVGSILYRGTGNNAKLPECCRQNYNLGM